MSYEIVKALHIISVIAWMAGLLYLPRLFVYHADTPSGSVQAETFKIMERRLLKAIMNPAMIFTFIFGIWMLVLAPALLTEIWMMIKIVCVFGLAGCHGLFSRMRRDLENDRLPYSSKVYRIWNEAPTVLMIIIVVMAVVKPDFT
ncbi:MAG: protoporphyrinogen oxidase HemJ [Alphaproteobacteria bacterium]|jgi:putative membrane protein|nr:protoporphyrinogen oxidase HemJ [Alphaproteobacteria bacterium]